jgi:hypothetical protein
VWPLPTYDARCLLICIEVLFLRGTFWLAGSIVRTLLACYDLRRSLTNYGRYEPVNNAIISLNKYCHWFGFCGEVGCDMFRDRLKSALSGERLGHQRDFVI